MFRPITRQNISPLFLIDQSAFPDYVFKTSKLRKLPRASSCLFGDGGDRGDGASRRLPVLQLFGRFRAVQGRDGPGRFGSSVASGRRDGVDTLRGVEAKRTRL